MLPGPAFSCWKFLCLPIGHFLPSGFTFVWQESKNLRPCQTVLRPARRHQKQNVSQNNQVKRRIDWTKKQQVTCLGCLLFSMDPLNSQQKQTMHFAQQRRSYVIKAQFKCRPHLIYFKWYFFEDITRLIYYYVTTNYLDILDSIFSPSEN